MCTNLISENYEVCLDLIQLENLVVDNEILARKIIDDRPTFHNDVSVYEYNILFV